MNMADWMERRINPLIPTGAIINFIKYFTGIVLCSRCIFENHFGKTLDLERLNILVINLL